MILTEEQRCQQITNVTVAQLTKSIENTQFV
jgi:hypothetical protein